MTIGTLVAAAIWLWPSRSKPSVAAVEKPPTLEGKRDGEEGGEEHSQEGTVEVDDETAKLIGIKTEEVAAGQIEEDIAVPGKALAASNSQAVIGAKVDGRALRVLAEPGQAVGAGQVLVVVDSPQVADLRGQLTEALGESNENFSGGFITGAATEMDVRGLGRINSLDDVGRVVVAVRDGSAVRRGIARVNGREAALMTIAKQFGADTLSVAERAKKALEVADRMYDSARIAHDTRWEPPLPSKAETIGYTQRILERVLEQVTAGSARQVNGYDEAYFLQLALFHEDMHAEAITYTRQTLGYPAPHITYAAFRRRGDLVIEVVTL